MHEQPESPGGVKKKWGEDVMSDQFGVLVFDAGPKRPAIFSQRLLQTVKKLTNLRHVGLQYCALDRSALSGLLNGLKQTKVETLCVDGNPRAFVLDDKTLPVKSAAKSTSLKNLGEALGALGASLRTLSLGRNIMGGKQLIEIAEGISKMKKLKCLCLEENQIGSPTNLEDGRFTLGPLSEMWGKMQLTNFDLSSNHLGSAAMVEVIGPLLEGMESLEWLSVSNNCIGPIGMKELERVLNSNLLVFKCEESFQSAEYQSQNLRANDLSLCVEALISIINRSPKLQVLNFALNDLVRMNTAPERQADIYPRLGSAIGNLQNMRSLDFSRNRLGSHVLDLLGVALEGCPKLISLCLEYSDFTGEGEMPRFASGIRSLTSLASLDLNNCELKLEGIQLLADGFGGSTRLKYLTLAGEVNCIKFVESLGGFISSLDLFQLIFTGQNHFSKETMIVMAPALKGLKKLQRLTIQIDIDAFGAFVDPVASLVKLHDLECLANELESHQESYHHRFVGPPQISTHTWQKFKNALKNLSGLRGLALESIPIENDGPRILGSSLKYLPRLQFLSLRAAGLQCHTEPSYPVTPGFHDLAVCVGNIQGLQIVDFERNCLHLDNVEALCTELQKLVGKCLKTIRLRENMIYETTDGIGSSCVVENDYWNARNLYKRPLTREHLQAQGLMELLEVDSEREMSSELDDDDSESWMAHPFESAEDDEDDELQGGEEDDEDDAGFAPLPSLD